MKVLSELLVVCLLAALHVNARPDEMSLSEGEQHVMRRYAESAIASEMSKIMDSMVQKNFVDFLLKQKEKRSKPATAEEDPSLYDLLKLCHEKQQRNTQVQ